MLKNALIIVLSGIATLVFLLVTLFAAMTSPRSPYEVWAAYGVTLAVFALRSQPAGSSHSDERLGGLRRLATRILIVSAVGCATGVASSLIGSIRPSEESLVARFREHRALYEELRDRAVKGAPMPPAGCAPVGCPTLGHDETVRFDMAGWGAANNGWRISLVWSKAIPVPLIPSLDGFQKTSSSRSQWDTAYSRIEGDWYLSIVW